MSNTRHSVPNLIYRNDVLNGLVAIQAAYRDTGSNHLNDAFGEGYKAGFDTALLAVAQMLGQPEIFLAQKAKLKINSG